VQTKDSDSIAKLNEQNKQLQTQLSCFKTKVGHNQASTKCNTEDQQSDVLNYPELQALFETDVDIQSVTDKCVNSVKVCGARLKTQSRVKDIDTLQSVVKHSPFCSYKQAMQI